MCDMVAVEEAKPSEVTPPGGEGAIETAVPPDEHTKPGTEHTNLATSIYHGFD